MSLLDKVIPIIEKFKPIVQTLAERKLKLIRLIIETESLEVIEAIENLLFEESFEQSISNEEKQLLDNFLNEGVENQVQKS